MDVEGGLGDRHRAGLTRENGLRRAGQRIVPNGSRVIRQRRAPALRGRVPRTRAADGQRAVGVPPVGRPGTGARLHDRQGDRVPGVGDVPGKGAREARQAEACKGSRNGVGGHKNKLVAVNGCVVVRHHHEIDARDVHGILGGQESVGIGARDFELDFRIAGRVGGRRREFGAGPDENRPRQTPGGTERERTLLNDRRAGVGVRARKRQRAAPCLREAVCARKRARQRDVPRRPRGISRLDRHAAPCKTHVQRGGPVGLGSEGAVDQRDRGGVVGRRAFDDAAAAEVERAGGAAVAEGEHAVARARAGRCAGGEAEADLLDRGGSARQQKLPLVAHRTPTGEHDA